MKQALPIVAIVGEPNVGKSTLLNRIAGGHWTITSKVPGTTRDRQYVNTSWNGVNFTLVDTAGITFQITQGLEAELNKQIDIALKQAEVIIFVVDSKAGPEAVERKALLKFRKIKRPIIVAVNKVDSPKLFAESVLPFRSFGLKSLCPVSALSGRGLGDLLDAVSRVLKDKGFGQKEEVPAPGIAVSIVGKPNVGKSSLFNKIIKEERVVVSPVPGTTRAAIDTRIGISGQAYTFIDTAGLKKKTHRQTEADIYAGFQTFKAIRRSDVCFLVIDATQEITVQDQKVAQEILQMEKGLIILANKIDLCDLPLPPPTRGGKLSHTRSSPRDGEDHSFPPLIKGGRWGVESVSQNLRNYISLHFPFLWMSPVFPVSALTGQGLNDALSAIKPIFEARHKTASQDELDVFLQNKLKNNPPKLLRDQKKPKVFRLAQVAANPPMFELLVNHPAAISKQFRDFLRNRIIKELNFWGTPVVLKLRGKDKK